ncbi:hypothetical protein MAC_00268 [Metarhizium acridum CQMa 102]|uniref:Uncharacterized protein n=1 Tax=Metarhizium acridum (strain CQMa 102) TaxID=655827 RepID=E9DR99_METAQ|nr:uncharacterized protein MAC_00268 [Metarhizium acridum CQMa 102]EFY93777.1 hypothetical protein MAC_00268 [Metarhizium acridum CQMa 102]
MSISALCDVALAEKNGSKISTKFELDQRVCRGRDSSLEGDVGTQAQGEENKSSGDQCTREEKEHLICRSLDTSETFSRSGPRLATKEDCLSEMRRYEDVKALLICWNNATIIFKNQRTELQRVSRSPYKFGAEAIDFPSTDPEKYLEDETRKFREAHDKEKDMLLSKKLLKSGFGTSYLFNRLAHYHKLKGQVYLGDDEDETGVRGSSKCSYHVMSKLGSFAFVGASYRIVRTKRMIQR